MVVIDSCRGSAAFVHDANVLFTRQAQINLLCSILKTSLEQAPAETDDVDGVSTTAARHGGRGRKDGCRGVFECTSGGVRTTCGLK